MKYLPVYLLMIFALFFTAGCEDLEEVPIYHEPYLNIFANVTADPGLNYVHVFRTTAYGDRTAMRSTVSFTMNSISLLPGINYAMRLLTRRPMP
ncbi:MAG: hypothetical protein U5N26_02970 [Candidatus Marinimicrobia bacterium]|nr:hypothetical protein [Candidatus Neomarinimicrobiota bacterium]